MIQLREKELSSLEFYNQAVAVKLVTDKYHIPLIINDRIDIAMAVQATGVHIGQHDFCLLYTSFFNAQRKAMILIHL